MTQRITKRNNVTRRFRNKAELYVIFAADWIDLLDFSEDALREQFYSETHGDPVSSNNGYNIGKQYLDVTVSMWIEDIRKGLLFKYELYEDPKFPDHWLDKVLK